MCFIKLSLRRRTKLKCSAVVACAMLVQWLLLPGVSRVWVMLPLLPDVPNAGADVHPGSSPGPVLGQQNGSALADGGLGCFESQGAGGFGCYSLHSVSPR